jgi:energy-coupling factor transporter transmembrane protein EcfT
MQLFYEHCEKDHLLSGIDARIKLIVAIVLLLLVVSYRGFAFPLIVAEIGRAHV